MLGNCDQEHGYILKVYDNVRILENTVATTSPGVFFHIEFSIKSLKPKKDYTYKGVVFTVFAVGIFVEVLNKMKILVPTDKMDGYKFKNNSFKKGNDAICTGSTVFVTVELIKYENHNFNCIGRLSI